MGRAEEVKSHVTEFILGNFPAMKKRALGDDTLLLESGVVDSIGVLEIVSFLEQKFEITVCDDDLIPENFSSISQIAAFVEARLQPAIPTENAGNPVCETR